MDIQTIMVEERFKRFRDLCREVRLEAQKNDLPSELVFAGVAWDFPTMFRNKTKMAWEKLFEEKLYE